MKRCLEGQNNLGPKDYTLGPIHCNDPDEALCCNTILFGIEVTGKMPGQIIKDFDIKIALRSPLPQDGNIRPRNLYSICASL